MRVQDPAVQGEQATADGGVTPESKAECLHAKAVAEGRESPEYAAMCLLSEVQESVSSDSVGEPLRSRPPRTWLCSCPGPLPSTGILFARF